MVAPAQETAGSSNREDASITEKQDLVVKITRTRDFYEILGIQRTATDEEIKRAYRKLALKLHPDKCSVRGADEAFKAVSKAFSCLSDQDKRAAYDRYGEQTPGLTRRANGAGPFYNDDFDPEELFNMFFNGGFGGAFGPPRGARVFHAHFGGGAVPPGFRRAQPQQPQPPAHPMAQLLHFIPVVLLVLFTILQMPGTPAYSLDKVQDYRHQLETSRLGVPYFVRDLPKFERSHAVGSRNRARVENEVEQLYRERLEQRCYAERLNQERLRRWGQVERAKAFPLPNCEQLQNTFGNARFQNVFAY